MLYNCVCIYIYMYTYCTVQSPSWAANGFAASQEIPPHFTETRRFITALTSVRHLSLSWASPIQSTYPHPTSWRSFLILSTHLRLGLPIGLLPFDFPTKTLYNTLSSPIRATCPAHHILLELITRTILGEEYNFCITLIIVRVLHLMIRNKKFSTELINEGKW